jgi:WD40 repeat protein
MGGRLAVFHREDVDVVEVANGLSRWNLPTGLAARCGAFGTNSATLVIGCEDGGVEVWQCDSESGEPRARRRWDLRQGEAAVNAEAISHDDTMVAVGRADGSAQVWRLAPQSPGGELVSAVGGQRSVVTAVSLTGDGARMHTAYEDGTAQVWAVQDRLLVDTLTSQRQRASFVNGAVSPDGRIVWAVDDLGNLLEWKGQFAGFWFGAFRGAV